MIPNPTKTITFKAPIDKVKEAVENITTTLEKVNAGGYKLKEKNDMIDQYVFEKTETLSLGSNITLELSPVGDQTQVNIEVSRVIGSFDQGFEVTNAMNHIKNVTKAILWYLNPEESQEQMTQESSVNETGNSIMVVMAIVVGFLMLGVIL